VTKFRRWLELRGLNEFSGAHVLNYLAGVTPGAFESQRTALTTTIHQNSGIELSATIMFKRFSQGTKNLFPKDAKYDEMWNARVIYEFYNNRPVPTSNIDLRTRANVLIRLSVAGRNKDLAHIHRESIIWGKDWVKIRLFRWKTQRHNPRRFTNFMLINKADDPKNCAYEALRAYMGLHTDDYETLEAKSIWLAFNGTKEVLPDTLANCTRRLMSEAGINVVMFGSATLRHAAITFWRQNGVSRKTVNERTGHKCLRLVAIFYDRSDMKDIMTELLNSGGTDQFTESSDEEGEDGYHCDDTPLTS